MFYRNILSYLLLKIYLAFSFNLKKNLKQILVRLQLSYGRFVIDSRFEDCNFHRLVVIFIFHFIANTWDLNHICGLINRCQRNGPQRCQQLQQEICSGDRLLMDTLISDPTRLPTNFGIPSKNASYWLFSISVAVLVKRNPRANIETIPIIIRTVADLIVTISPGKKSFYSQP